MLTRNPHSARRRLRRQRPFTPRSESLEPRQLLALTAFNVAATEVTDESAIIGGRVDNPDGVNARVSVFWGDNDGGTETAQWDDVIEFGPPGTGESEFSTPLSGLSPSTEYFYRVQIFSFAEVVWAEQTASFSTLGRAVPELLLGVQEVGGTAARLDGQISSDDELLSATVYYGTRDGGDNPDDWQQAVELAATTGPFTLDIDRLLPDTTHYARVSAVSGGGTGWSETQTLATLSVPVPLRISEVMANNASTLPTRVRLSSDSEFAGPTNSHDWVELQNASNDALDIGGYYLTDSPSDPTRWRIPDNTIIPARASLVILASGQDISDPALDEQGLLHTNFALGAGGEYMGLLDPQQRLVHELADGYPQQLPDISHGFVGANFGQLATATPGQGNLATGLPIDGVQHRWSSEGGPLIVEASIDRQAGTPAAVELHYRSMFEAEQTLTMVDNGTGDDAVADDGVFSATIPTGIAQPGQMIRYYVTATNSQDVTTRMPRFLTPDNSPEYFGTMVDDPSIESQLPVFHRFIESVADADRVSGTRASVYYNGEFYDNVFIRIRGGTALSWPKKSYKVEFNDGYHFRFQPDLPRVDEFNLNATYTDKSYVRATLAYELYDNTGGKGPITFPLRLHQNGEFFSVALFVEQPDRDYLRRNGLSPDGALYKARHDRLNGLVGTAEGFFEKKTRHPEDYADLQALIDGLALTGDDLEQFLFDNVDLPSQINLMAVNLILQNIDATDKNYYIYRDSVGNGEWQMLPWDLDLVLGPNALNTDTIVWQEETGPAYTSHPYLGTLDFPFHGRKNHLFDAVVKNPRTNAMFLRRVRTLMDDFLAASDTPVEQRYFETRIDQLVEMLGPDVLLDKERWGRQTHFNAASSTLLEATDRIKNEYLANRRPYLFERHNVDKLIETETTDLVSEFSTADYLVPSNDDLGDSWTGRTEPANQDQWQSGPMGFGFERETRDRFEPFIGTRVRPNETCTDCTNILLRVPFSMGNPDTIEQMTLRMRYDDGFVAYINGVEVARRNSRDEVPGFASRAFVHTNDLAVEFEEINISDKIPSLDLGPNNVLAIRAINSSRSGNDMLISPALVEGLLPDRTAVGIPHRQVEVPAIIFGNFDANPASGNQDQEFIELRNESDQAVDISGWLLTGGIDHQFKAGTVIEAHKSIYVTPDSAAFRTRETGPTGGMGLLVQDRYRGHLSNLGETIELRTATGEVISRLTTPPVLTPVQEYLRISELNYHPQGDLQTEFIELTNTSRDTTLDLAGVTMTDGPAEPFVFPAGTTLAPGEFLLVVEDTAAFRAAYPEVPADIIAGQFQGALANRGERIKLDDVQGSTIVEFSYDDDWPWPLSADGIGPSLELIDPLSTPAQEMGKHHRWAASVPFGGTPGTPRQASSQVVVNELVLDDGPAATIEIYNGSAATVDVGGWWLSTADDASPQFQIPADTRLPSDHFIVLDRNDFGDALQLSPNVPTDLWLLSADPVGLRLHDEVHLSTVRGGESYGRVRGYEDGLVRMTSSLGQFNLAPRVGPLLISEVQYAPGAPSAAAQFVWAEISTDDLEFVEIHNPTDTVVDLAGWQLDGGVEYDFANASILSGQTIIVVSFDPTAAHQVRRLDAFRAHYGLDESAVIIGGYAGRLSDNSDDVQLLRPAADRPEGSSATWTEDVVLYDDLSPWPPADGTGLSLQRIAAASLGVRSTAWSARVPTPGQAPLTSGDFDASGIVDVDDIDRLCLAIRDQQVDEIFDINGDQAVDHADMDVMLAEIVHTRLGDANLDGRFDDSDLLEIFAAGEFADGLAGNSTWAEGDWNCDGEFDSGDLLAALQLGEYGAR